MSKPGFSYDQDKVRKWFGITSFLLLLVVIWMIVDDVMRDWKGFQRAFYNMETDRIEREISSEDKKLDKEALDRVDQEIASAQKGIEEQEGEIDTLRIEIANIEKRFFVVDTATKTKKSLFDSKKYIAETADHHDHKDKAKAVYAEMDELDKEINEGKLEVEKLNTDKAEKEKRLEALLANLTSAKSAKQKLFVSKRKLEGELDEVDLSTLKNTIRNLPLLDFFAPTIDVRQVVLPEIRQDLNFVQVPSVDRCMTCHVAIDKKGYEFKQNWNEKDGKWEVAKDKSGNPVPMEHPFRSHPDLDLYLGATSPHPMSGVGCTSCHFGQGNSIDFNWAGHMPAAGEQGKATAKEWKDKYGWHALKSTHWPTPMLPADYSQAMCLRCHTEQHDPPVMAKFNEDMQEYKVYGAHKLQEARDLIGKYGCYNCHNMQGFEERKQVGPSLRRVASKLDKDWAWRWINNPKDVNKKSRMPTFFGLQNVEGAEDRMKANAEIHGIVKYLWENSEEFNPNASKLHSGSAARGEELFKTIGCKACHATTVEDWNPKIAFGLEDDDEDEDDEEEEEEEEGEEKEEAGQSLPPGEHFGAEEIPAGPNLATSGYKLNKEWLFDWVKNPSHYNPETVMPSLRLSDGEASDIVAYLMERKSQKTESPIPEADGSVVDELLVHHLKTKNGVLGSREVLKKMTHGEKLSLLGEKSIARYGCYSCHSIKGFEGRLPIGADLRKHGNKNILRLDFGHTTPEELPRTRYDWIAKKVESPRMFDQGRRLDYFSKTRMPKFWLNEDKAKLISMAVIGQVKDTITTAGKVHLEGGKALAEKGERVITKYNCRSCHMIDFKGGALSKAIGDTNAAPPALVKEGSKVQVNWLYHFLKKPTPIRPMVKVRMPTYPFSQDELNSLLQYFNHKTGETFPFQSSHQYSGGSKFREEGKKLFKAVNCQLCHGLSWSEVPGRLKAGGVVAPPLNMAFKRLRGDWMTEWIKNPTAFYPGVGMPAFWANGPIADHMMDIEGNKDRVEAQLRAVTDFVMSIGDPAK